MAEKYEVKLFCPKPNTNKNVPMIKKNKKKGLSVLLIKRNDIYLPTAKRKRTNIFKI